MQLIKLVFIVIKYNLSFQKIPWIFRINVRIWSIFFLYFWYQKPIEVRLRMAIEDMGVLYIKFAQHCANFNEIFDDNIIRELSKMQTSLKTYPYEEIINIIKQNLGSLFYRIESINEIPVGSASIAQVHSGILNLSNRKVKVAIKIIKPNVKISYKNDINFLYFTIRLVNKFTNKLDRFNLNNVIKIFESSMKNEINLLMEAASMDEMRSLDIPNLFIPKVYWNFSSENVLIMEYIDGVKIDDIDLLSKRGLCRNKVIYNLSTIFFHQAYEHGFFHADLHPGNIMVIEDNKICMLDFGIMGQISKKDRLVIAAILYNFIKRDYLKVSQIHQSAGHIDKNVDVNDFARSMRIIGMLIFDKELKNISIALLLRRLLYITRKYNMRTQPQLILIQKSTLSIERIVKKLNPNTNPWNIIRPWIKTWSIQNISPFAIIKSKFKEKYQELFRFENLFK